MAICVENSVTVNVKVLFMNTKAVNIAHYVIVNIQSDTNTVQYIHDRHMLRP